MNPDLTSNLQTLLLSKVTSLLSTDMNNTHGGWQSSAGFDLSWVNFEGTMHEGKSDLRNFVSAIFEDQSEGSLGHALKHVLCASVDNITEARLLLVEPSTGFNTHNDTGHNLKFNTSNSALVLHINIATTQDYIPGNKGDYDYTRRINGPTEGKKAIETSQGNPLTGKQPGTNKKFMRGVTLNWGVDEIYFDFGTNEFFTGGVELSNKIRKKKSDEVKGKGLGEG